MTTVVWEYHVSGGSLTDISESLSFKHLSANKLQNSAGSIQNCF